MFKYLKGTNNVPEYEVNNLFHPVKTGFVTVVTMRLLSDMNEKQKFFALVGIVSAIAFIVIGYATDDWIQEYRGFVRGRSRYIGIAWHSVVPFLIAVASGVGWFLYKDNK